MTATVQFYAVDFLLWIETKTEIDVIEKRKSFFLNRFIFWTDKIKKPLDMLFKMNLKKNSFIPFFYFPKKWKVANKNHENEKRYVHWIYTRKLIAST